MDEHKRHFRLGLFVFISVIIVAGILFLLGGRSLFRPTMTFETYFNESVAGLDIGSPVKFRGVPLGQVTSIALSTTEYEMNTPFDKRRAYIIVRAKLTLSQDRIARIGREANDFVRSGLRVQTQLAGITGQQYLALDIFDPQKYPSLPFDWKPKYLYVPSAPSSSAEIIAGVQAFLANLNKADVQALGQSLNKLVVDVDKKISDLPVADISSEASALLKDVGTAVGRLDGLLARPDVDATLRNVASATGRVDGIFADPGIKQTVDNLADVGVRMRNFAASGEMDRTVKSLDDSASRLSVMVGDNQLDLRVIVEDLRVTADNIRVLSEALKRNPTGVLVGGPPEKIQLPGKSP
jgi:hypothetical protein